MEHIEKATKILQEGGIIIFPTDTAFGIGCLIDNHSAIERLFEIRKRPLSQPTPILVSSLSMAQNYGDFSDDVIEKLVTPYWPGALTIIVPAKPASDSLVVKDGGIGLRMPDSSVTLSLIEKSGKALLGPSANFHGLPTPFTFGDLDPALCALVDYVVPGQTKGSTKASTLIDTKITPWEILRYGGVDMRL